MLLFVLQSHNTNTIIFSEVNTKSVIAIWIYVLACVRVCACLRACARICVCVCACVCACLCACVCMHVCVPVAYTSFCFVHRLKCILFFLSKRQQGAIHFIISLFISLFIFLSFVNALILFFIPVTSLLKTQCSHTQKKN